MVLLSFQEVRERMRFDCVGGAMSQIKILVVDDEEDIREVIGLHLEREGYEILEAEDGETAIQILAEGDNMRRIGLILCDIRMPKVNGVECVEIFKQRAPEIPIVVITGYPDEGLATSLKERGAQDYLVKPVEKKTLVETVRKFIHSGAQGES